MLFRVLLLSPSPSRRARLRRLLSNAGVLLAEDSRPEDLWARLGNESFDLIVAQEGALPEPVEGSVAEIRALPDRPEVILLTESEEAEHRVALQAAGCLAVLSETVADGGLREALETLVQRQREAATGQVRARQESRRSALHDFSSRSAAMRELLRLARKVVPADTSLLILGETGVGKEWLARAIHAEGPRAAAPFIAVNCAAMPEALLESELFGHEKGSFTGALRARRGHFELAHRGTLFLDEIGDLSFHLQAKLLRALQERTIHRLGSERGLPVDVRVMAATNQDLEVAIGEHRFRRDLFYRLSVMTLAVPPLRERRQDVQPLVETYFQQFRTQLGRTDVRELSSEALRALEAYPWPGNVRELINVLERAVLLCEGHLVTLDDLPEAVTSASLPLAEAAAPGDLGFPAGAESWLSKPLAAGREALVRRFESAYLASLLERTRGNVGETAARAGIDPRTLYNKMRAYGLRKEDFRRPEERTERLAPRAL